MQVSTSFPDRSSESSLRGLDSAGIIYLSDGALAGPGELGVATGHTCLV